MVNTILNIMLIVGTVFMGGLFILRAVRLIRAGHGEGVKKLAVRPVAAVWVLLILFQAVAIPAAQTRIKTYREGIALMSYVRDSKPEGYQKVITEWARKNFGVIPEDPDRYISEFIANRERDIKSEKLFTVFAVYFSIMCLVFIEDEVQLITSLGFRGSRLKETVPLSGKLSLEKNEIQLFCTVLGGKKEKVLKYRATPKNLSALGCFIEWDEPSAESSAESSAELSAESSAEPSAESSAESFAEISAEPSAESSAEISAELSVESSAESSAEISAEPSVESSAETPAEPSAESSAETSAERSGDTPT